MFFKLYTLFNDETISSPNVLYFIKSFLTTKNFITRTISLKNLGTYSDKKFLRQNYFLKNSPTFSDKILSPKQKKKLFFISSIFGNETFHRHFFFFFCYMWRRKNSLHQVLMELSFLLMTYKKWNKLGHRHKESQLVELV